MVLDSMGTLSGEAPLSVPMLVRVTQC